MYVYVLFVCVLKTDLFLNDSTVKQKWNWSLSRHDMTQSEADAKIPRLLQTCSIFVNTIHVYCACMFLHAFYI